MYIKKCPSCGDDIVYKTKDSLNQSIKRNSSCKPCGRKSAGNKQRKIKHCEICNVELSKSKVGKTCSDKCRVESIKQTKLKRYGSSTYNNRDKATATTIDRYGVENVSQIDEVKAIVTSKGRYYSRVDVSGENNPMFGKTHTDDTKLKQRVTRVESLLHKKNCYPGYNPNAIPFLEEKARELGITDLQHAENGGEFHIKELGYFVDGYSAEKNIVIEYDEPHHKYQVEKDQKRQKEIEDYLKCKFIRIS